MKASMFYRIAAVLLLLFAVGHTLGFRQSDPKWGVDALLGSMRSIHFDVQGFNRTYWDLFEAAGFSIGVFYLFAAILAWQLGGLPAATLALMRGTAWAFALCFAAITVVSWRYLFVIPIAFSIVVTFAATAPANGKRNTGNGDITRLPVVALQQICGYHFRVIPGDRRQRRPFYFIGNTAHQRCDRYATCAAYSPRPPVTSGMYRGPVLSAAVSVSGDPMNEHALAGASLIAGL